jgi:hypothetical protein
MLISGVIGLGFLMVRYPAIGVSISVSIAVFEALYRLMTPHHKDH